MFANDNGNITLLLSLDPESYRLKISVSKAVNERGESLKERKFIVVAQDRRVKWLKCNATHCDSV